MRRYILVALLFTACTKVAPVAPLSPPHTGYDTTQDVRQVLDSVPGFSLFALAVKTAHVDTLLAPGNFYTLFVPTDSAMKAVGLNAQSIPMVPADSLSKWVQYHIAFGNVSGEVLTDAPVSVQLYSIRQDAFPSGFTYNIYQYSLFAKVNNQGILYINGQPEGVGETPTRASNGYLYPIDRVLNAPGQRVFDVIRTRPELSLYYFSLTLLDSMFNATYYGFQPFPDSTLFSQVGYVTYIPGSAGSVLPVLPTVFAPTNQAFAAAGFSTEDDLRQYVYNTQPYQITILIPGEGYQPVVTDFPLDSVLKSHYLYNASQNSFANLLCYNDLVDYPGINNNVLNVCNPYGNFAVAQLVPVPLQFSASASGVLNIRFNPTVPEVQIPYDSTRSFMTLNGLIYESNQLFYPHN